MKWALYILVLSHPTPTGLVYDDIGSCYAAEDVMRAEMTNHYNDMIELAKKRPERQTQAYLDLQASRLFTGICIPHN